MSNITKLSLSCLLFILVMGLLPLYRKAHALGCNDNPSCGNPNGTCHRACVPREDRPWGVIGKCATVFDGASACDDDTNNECEDGEPCELTDGGGSCWREVVDAGDNSISGFIYKRYANPIPDGSGRAQYKFEGLEGVTVAWIEDPNLPDANGSRQVTRRYSYKRAESQADPDGDGPESAGKFELRDLPNEPLFVGVFCGSTIKRVYATDWGKDQVPYTSTTIRIELDGDLTCEGAANDVCVRPTVDTTDYTDHSCAEQPQNDPVKDEIKYNWTRPQLRAAFTWTDCLAQPLNCINIGGNVFMWYIANQFYYATGEFSTNRAAWIESQTAAWGCNPAIGKEDGLPLPEEIRNVNVNSRGLNNGKCGKVALKRMNPAKVKALVEDLYGRNPFVMKTETGEKIKIEDVANPYGTKVNLADYRFSQDYFPYYLLAADTNEDLDNTLLSPNFLGASGSVIACTGYNCKAGDGTDLINGITKAKIRGGAYSSYSAEASAKTSAWQGTNPATNPADNLKAPSGLYRVDFYGMECDCPAGRDSTGRCKDSGVKLSFAQAIDFTACTIVTPPPPGCGSSNFSQDSVTKVELPRASEHGGEGSSLCNSLTSPANELVTVMGGLGSTTADSGIKYANVPTPYGVDGQSTVVEAKECAARKLRIPRDDFRVNINEN